MPVKKELNSMWIFRVKVSPLNPLYLTKKQLVFQRITAKVETSTHNNKRGITERP